MAQNKRFLEVFTGNYASPPPFWFMRQAGRYMPEYRALRAKAGSFLNLCMNPQYAAEVTLQPIGKFNMDAAILFADILLVPLALGMDLKFEDGAGPKLGKLDIPALNFDESKLQPVYETIKIVKTKLPQDKALIGFAGSPWTVATYMIEGGSSKDFAKIKLFSRQPEFKQLMDILVDATSQYLISQIEAGAETIQLFDSWAGELQEKDFTQWVIEPTIRIIKNVRIKHPKVKIVGFPRRAKLPDLKKFATETGVDALSIDSAVPLEWAFANLNCVIQGNLDPQILLAEKEAIKQEAEKILKTAYGKPFIFNLGHGIVPQTPVENVEYLSNLIRNA